MATGGPLATARDEPFAFQHLYSGTGTNMNSSGTEPGQEFLLASRLHSSALSLCHVDYSCLPVFVSWVSPLWLLSCCLLILRRNQLTALSRTDLSPATGGGALWATPTVPFSCVPYVKFEKYFSAHVTKFSVRGRSFYAQDRHYIEITCWLTMYLSIDQSVPSVMQLSPL